MTSELVSRAKQGDKGAFNTLIESHREVLFRYAYLIVRDATVAEDVVQEAILRIYRAINRFDEGREFRPWALSITRNLARNNNRAWGRYKHMIVRFLNGRETQKVDIETLTHRQQQASLLHEAVSQLPSDFQDVIYARYFMNLSVEESSSALGIAEGTVKSRSHRALKHLRALLEREYPQLVEEFDYE